MQAIVLSEIRARQLPTHCGQLVGAEAEGFQIGQAPPDFAERRLEFQAAAIGSNGAVAVPGGFQRMAIAHPHFRIARVVFQQVGIDADGGFVVTDPAQHHRLEIAVSKMPRIGCQQMLDLDQRLLRPVAAMQDQRVILPRCLEAGGQLQAALEQMQGVLVATQPGSDFGEHADRGNVSRRLLQVFAQQGLGRGDAVLDQGDGGSQQARVAGGVTHMAPVRRVGRLLFAGRHQVIAKRAPGLRQIGLQRHRATQRLDRFLPAPAMAKRQPQVEMDHGPVRLGLRQRNEDVERALHVPLQRACSGQQLQCSRMTRSHLQDLVELLDCQQRISLQQAFRVGHGLFQRADG